MTFAAGLSNRCWSFGDVYRRADYEQEAVMEPQHWRSMREIFGDPDLGLPSGENQRATAEYARGLELMSGGCDAQGAYEAFKRADQHGHAGAIREIGLALAASGDLETAVECYERAFERGDGRGASSLGTWCVSQGNLTDARRHFEFGDGSGDPEGSRELGRLLDRSGDLHGAEAALRRSDNRGSASGSLALGIFLRDKRGDVTGAEEAFRRAEQRGHPKGAINLIDIYSDRGDIAAMEAAKERALELAARHHTVFEEMQDPDFVQHVRRAGVREAAASGSGCVMVTIAALLASVAIVAVGPSAVRRHLR